MLKQSFVLLLMLSVAFSAADVTFNPTSGNANCHTGNLTWTGTGFPAEGNVTLDVGGVSQTIDSCSTGTSNDDNVTATAGGDFVCITTVSTSQVHGTTTHATTDLDGGAGNTSTSFDYRYCRLFGTADAQEATVDTITGLFAGFAGMSNTLGLAILGLVLVGLVVGFILAIKKLY